MTVESYERTWDQNEELGLNDIKVEGYESDRASIVGDASVNEDGESASEKVAVETTLHRS